MAEKDSIKLISQNKKDVNTRAQKEAQLNRIHATKRGEFHLAFLLDNENHRQCRWFPKALALRNSRRSGRLPCVKGAVAKRLRDCL